jgi:hypothetical protein
MRKPSRRSIFCVVPTLTFECPWVGSGCAGHKESPDNRPRLQVTHTEKKSLPAPPISSTVESRNKKRLRRPATGFSYGHYVKAWPSRGFRPAVPSNQNPTGSPLAANGCTKSNMMDFGSSLESTGHTCGSTALRVTISPIVSR